MLLGYKNLYLLGSFTNISNHLHSFANLFFCSYDMSVFPKILALLAPSFFFHCQNPDILSYWFLLLAGQQLHVLLILGFILLSSPLAAKGHTYLSFCLFLNFKPPHACFL